MPSVKQLPTINHEVPLTFANPSFRRPIPSRRTFAFPCTLCSSFSSPSPLAARTRSNRLYGRIVTSAFRGGNSSGGVACSHQLYPVYPMDRTHPSQQLHTPVQRLLHPSPSQCSTDPAFRFPLHLPIHQPDRHLPPRPLILIHLE